MNTLGLPSRRGRGLPFQRKHIETCHSLPRRPWEPEALRDAASFGAGCGGGGVCAAGSHAPEKSFREKARPPSQELRRPRGGVGSADQGCLSPGSPSPTPHPRIPPNQALEHRTAGAGKFCCRWHVPRPPNPSPHLSPPRLQKHLCAPPRSAGERPPTRPRSSSNSPRGCAPRRCFCPCTHPRPRRPRPRPALGVSSAGHTTLHLGGASWPSRTPGARATAGRGDPHPHPPVTPPQYLAL